MHHQEIECDPDNKKGAKDAGDQVALAKKLEGEQSATSPILELHGNLKKAVESSKKGSQEGEDLSC